MAANDLTRRDFVKAGAMLAAATPYWFSSASRAAEEQSKNDRPLIGSIGVGGRGLHISVNAKHYGDIVAICDVDRKHAELAKKKLKMPKAELFDDYRRLLDRKDIEAVIIGTPDHWHVPISLAALAAGKHVYCEKPLTLTVDEGKQLVAATKKSGKTFQVGTMQRSEITQFARAVATVRGGQLGKIKKVIVNLPASTLEGGPFPAKPVPKELNWDMWLGQAPLVDYVPERCHYTFRWWYDYSGGIMTDWGAHHMDIVQWGLDCENSGPKTVDGSTTTMPHIEGGYNTPIRPIVNYLYPNDVIVEVRIEAAEGKRDELVTFEGEKSTMEVNRSRIEGDAIKAQDEDPKLMASTMEAVAALYKGNPVMKDHMGNFFEAFKHNLHPISDVESQHRSVSACHIANISMRLGRKLTWDAAKEDFVGDTEASAMLKRAQRTGYQFS